MSAAAALFLGILIPGFNPAWPAADPELPADVLARPESMPDDPEYPPREDSQLGCTGQHALYSFTPACTPGIAAKERDLHLGPGIRADRAWLWTTGRPEIALAALDSGADWSDPELAGHIALNAGELPMPDVATSSGTPPRYDRNGDGVFSVLDYTSATGTIAPTIDRVIDRALLRRADRGDANGNGLLDPQDLILVYSDGTDGDANGYVDDIAGWDFVDDDNDAADPEGKAGSGATLLRAAAATANNGVGGAGVCPRCSAIPLRVALGGVAPGNELAMAILYAADSGARIAFTGAASAGGSSFLDRAVEYARLHRMLMVASAGTASSLRRESLWDPSRVLVVGSIGYDRASRAEASSAVAPDPCSNFGAQLALAAPGRCDATPAALTAGALGLVLSASFGIPAKSVPELSPPLSAGELYQLATANAVEVAAHEGFDLFSGHGRADARAAIDAVIQRRIPLEPEITSPPPSAMIDPTPGSGFTVTARVANPRYARASWVLEYAIGVAPASSAFSPILSGNVAAGQTAEVIGTVPTEALFPDPTAPPEDANSFAVTIRFSASAAAGGDVARGETRCTVFVHRDLELLPGFPRALGTGVIGSARLADVDGDGRQEILVAGDDGRIFAVDESGKDLSGWPVSAPPFFMLDPLRANNHRGAPAFVSSATLAGARESILAAPTLSPIAKSELNSAIVAVTAGGSILRLDARGRAIGDPIAAARSRLVTRESPAGLASAPVLYDLDGDGTMELVLVTPEPELAVLRFSGEDFPGFPVPLPERTSAPAIGDLDGDGRPELVVASHDAVYVIHGDGLAHAGGAFFAGSPIALPPSSTSALGIAGGLDALELPAPVLGDADGDGQLDIAIATRGRSLLVFRAAGGIPFVVTSFDRGAFGAGSDASRPGGMVFAAGAAIALADLDGDGQLDAAGAIADAGQLRGLDPAANAESLFGLWSLFDGTFLPGAPRAIGRWSPGGPAIADIDGDERPEVIFGDGDGRLHAFSADGAHPRLWPKLTAGSMLGAPAIGDLDRDGRLDVVAVTREGMVFAWRGRGPKASTLLWPGFRHDDRATGNIATPTSIVSLRNLGSSCGCDEVRGSWSEASGVLSLVLVIILARRKKRAPNSVRDR